MNFPVCYPVTVLIAFIFGLWLSCGSFYPPVTMGTEEESKEEASPEDPYKVLEERTVEVLQLKSDVIILQSEIIRLKSEIIQLKDKNAQLQEQLRQKEKEISKLKQKLSLLQKGKVRSRSLSRDEFSIRYKEALNEYYAGNYRQAIERFAYLLAINSHHELSDNCQYWIGESYYSLKQYEQAIKAFRKVFTYQDPNKWDDAQMKLWLCYLRLGDKARAQEELQRLFTDYPNSEYVSKAKELLKIFGEAKDTHGISH